MDLVKEDGMPEPRVKAKLWVQMALRMGDVDGRPGAVLRSGDADAGGILIVLRGREGLSVLSQVRVGEGEVSWMRIRGPAVTPGSRPLGLRIRSARFIATI